MAGPRPVQLVGTNADRALAASDRTGWFSLSRLPHKGLGQAGVISIPRRDASGLFLSRRQIEPFTQAREWVTHGLTGRTTLLFELRNQFVSNVHCNLFVGFEGNLAEINGNGLLSSPLCGADKVLVKLQIAPVRAKVTNMFKVAQWSLNLKKNTLSDMIEHFLPFPSICQKAAVTHCFSIFADIFFIKHICLWSKDAYSYFRQSTAA